MTTTTELQTAAAQTGRQPVPLSERCILDPDALADKLAEWKARGEHILSPATRVFSFAPGWGVSVSKVLMDTKVDDKGVGTDTYSDGVIIKANERGLTRIGLVRISTCAGISWDPQHSIRTDDRRMLHFWEYKMVGVLMDFDGMARTIQGTAEVDYRDGSAQIGEWTPEKWRQLELENEAKRKADPNARQVYTIGGWSANRVLAARSKGLQRAETSAMERAIRTLGIKHKYTVDELQHPFVVLKATYVPNESDPQIRLMLAERAMGGVHALFAPRQASRPIDVMDITPEPQRALPEPVERFDLPVQREPAPVATHTTHQDINEAMPTLPRVASAVPPTMPAPSVPTVPANAVLVTDVKTLKSGTGSRGEWSLVKVSVSDGRSATTLDGKIVSDAREFLVTHTPVEMTTRTEEKDGKTYLNVATLLPAGQQPTLPGVETAPSAAGMKW